MGKPKLVLMQVFSKNAGGMVLHKGEIAEMKTGEGKTLVAILPAYLNALSGKGVHVVTVNDYLARRDCEWVGQVPRFLGLQVGLIQRMSNLPSQCFVCLIFCLISFLKLFLGFFRVILVPLRNRLMFYAISLGKI